MTMTKKEFEEYEKLRKKFLETKTQTPIKKVAPAVQRGVISTRKSGENRPVSLAFVGSLHLRALIKDRLNKQEVNK